MIDNLIKKLESLGKLRKQKAGIVQVEALLKEAMKDLNEANKISGIAERATYLLAYMAMLKAGRALLLLKGYTPDDGAQHRTVVEVTGVMLGDKFVSLVRHFETMRRKRNELTYEAGIPLTKTDSANALKDAMALVEGVLKEVKRLNPQFELKFDI